eukprot:4388983-Pyramimonas_sp.AAC.1
MASRHLQLTGCIGIRVGHGVRHIGLHLAETQLALGGGRLDAEKAGRGSRFQVLYGYRHHVCLLISGPSLPSYSSCW